jgi:hypothetical protein
MAVRCWDVDPRALARCPRLSVAQRILVLQHVREGDRQRRDRDELVAEIGRARAAVDRIVRPAPLPKACTSALAALPALEQALRAGDVMAAYEALRPLGRLLRPKPLPVAAE